MGKVHWDPDETYPDVGCGRYKHMVQWSAVIEEVTCKACKKAIVRMLNDQMVEESEEPRKFVRVGHTVCMRAASPSKLIFDLFDLSPLWTEDLSYEKNKQTFEQYAEDIVEMLNERYG